MARYSSRSVWAVLALVGIAVLAALFYHVVTGFRGGPLTSYERQFHEALERKVASLRPEEPGEIAIRDLANFDWEVVCRALGHSSAAHVGDLLGFPYPDWDRLRWRTSDNWGLLFVRARQQVIAIRQPLRVPTGYSFGSSRIDCGRVEDARFVRRPTPSWGPIWFLELGRQ